MQSFRVAKPARKIKSSKPRPSGPKRSIATAEAIESSFDNIAMVAYSSCVEEGVLCYYNREQSVSCSECLRRRRKCDGTFSTEEYRELSRLQKSKEEAANRQKKALVEAEAAVAQAQLELSFVRALVLKLEEEAAEVKERKS